MKKFVFIVAMLGCVIGLNAQKKATVKKAITNAAVSKKAESVKKSNDTLIEISTNYGTMIARLYNSTPLHRDNFIKLINNGTYDSLLFHRVIKGFMIQGGDPTSKHAEPSAMLGNGEIPNTPKVPAELRKDLIHKKGALAAARDNNPEKASSNCQFYIVQGNKMDTAQLSNGNYTHEQKEIYNRIGGSPFLDNNYTVFGEVLQGLDVIDKIAATKTGNADRPVEDIIMRIKILR